MGAFIEHQFGESLGSRFGFVMKTEDDLYASYQAARPTSAYSVPFPFVDIGVDGVRGTADDRNLTLYGMPTSQAASFPVNSTVMNTGRYSRYKTIEGSMNKRAGGKWSVSAGTSYTMLNDFPQGFPNNPNAPGLQERSTWDFKLTGSFDAPSALKLTPADPSSIGSELRAHDQRGAVGGNAVRPDLQRHDLRRHGRRRTGHVRRAVDLPPGQHHHR